jgi:hypothetical protein
LTGPPKTCCRPVALDVPSRVRVKEVTAIREGFHKWFVGAAVFVTLTCNLRLPAAVADSGPKEKESAAIAVARAHVDAWSNHN